MQMVSAIDTRGRRQRGAGNSPTKGDRICFYYRDGNCSYGEKCRFKHEGPTKGGGAAAGAAPARGGASKAKSAAPNNYALSGPFDEERGRDAIGKRREACVFHMIQGNEVLPSR